MGLAVRPLSPEVLKGTELFADVPAEGLAEAWACGRVRHLPKHQTVFTQGEPAERAHALIEGRIRIGQTDHSGAQLVVRFIGPGEMFGTVGLFTDHLYPAHAETVMDSIEVSWTEAALLDLIVRYPRIALNIVGVIGARLVEAQERLREVSTQRVERRIANALLRLAVQAGHIGNEGTAIDFPLSRKDVAEMCGSTLHTVSRTLTAWEKAGAIATSQQRVTIRDIADIRRRADDSET